MKSTDTIELQHPKIRIDALDHLWFQVSGTLCNIACNHCFISCSPTNHTFEFMTLAQVESYLEESVALGVKEYYFTGGEPFMNPDILPILEKTLQYGPATVLSNGMLIRRDIPRKLAEMESKTRYSLEIRVSMDGYTEEMNDAIRGKGVFQKAMSGVRGLVKYGFLPIITIVQTWEEYETDDVLAGFTETLKQNGYHRPRIKILPSLKLGREIVRTQGYDRYEYVTEEMMDGFDADQLICANARMATNRGVYVCPILIEEPKAYLGRTLHESMVPYEIKQQACFTCYLYGAICSNFNSVNRDA